MMKRLTRNAILAALYVAFALVLPSTALANYRLATALYVLAAWDPTLIPGLAFGNALAGLPQGPLDMLLGAGVGLLTAWACSKLGKWSPVAVLLIPTLVVPLWLGWLYHAPYTVVVLVLLKGQLVSAALGWYLLRLKRLREIVTVS